MLKPISQEQQQVIDYLKTNRNVVVNSVAGSGKTTCNLHIATYFTEKNILLLTYNSKLKLETREKVKALKLTKLETHSYHSFCVKYYHHQCFTDTEIDDILENNTKPQIQFHYDFIILDEAQDISPRLFQLICKIARDNNDKQALYCVMGDEKQSIYDFNRADQRFITFAEQIFKFNSFPWNKCKLSQSFRITKPMAEFLNGCALNEERIFSDKEITSKNKRAVKPKYFICDAFNYNENRVYEVVKHYIKNGYEAEDIFVLAASILNPKTPIRYLENKLKHDYKNQIPIFIPTDDETPLEEDVVRGKMVFSTFHQAKGLERKIVIVYGFDNSYFSFTRKAVIPIYARMNYMLL